MTDDPGHDYDVHCRQLDEQEDPDCEACDGNGFSYGSIPQGCADCLECGGSGRERDAVKRRAAERDFEDNVRWADEWGPIILGDEWFSHQSPTGGGGRDG